MLSGLILLSIALTAFVGVMCILLYRQQTKCLRLNTAQQELLLNYELSFKDLSTRQEAIHKRIDKLATDVLQREIYHSADDRHQLAIQSAKEGRGVRELMQRHGLSSDEAALIGSLHSPKSKVTDVKIKNANFSDLFSVDVT